MGGDSGEAALSFILFTNFLKVSCFGFWDLVFSLYFGFFFSVSFRRAIE